jgi:uncharacterized protein with von Willebrand factor type A (vWA) domain
VTNPAAPTLAANVMHFARMLRRAGLPVGPAETLAAQQALSLVDLGSRTEVRTALRAAMIHRHEHQDVFEQAFNLFWRDPTAAEQAVAMALLEAQKEKRLERPPPGSRRVAEAMARPRENRPRPEDEPPVMDAVLTVSDQERLQRMDFEAMGAEEIAEAKREIRRLVLPLDARRTRRLRSDLLGPVIDLRRTIRQSLRQGGEILTIARNRHVTRPPPLVVLCDISGSMSRYAQILLHFLHAVTNDRDRVHVFLFGTRLSNVSRQLRHRDPEVAFQLVSHIVPDWSGGTRIGEALKTFLDRYGARGLARGAVVLIISDGWETGDAAVLKAQMARLSRLAYRIVWANPRTASPRYEPLVAGMAAAWPYCDTVVSAHSLWALDALLDALATP